MGISIFTFIYLLNGEYEKDIGVRKDYCGNLKFLRDQTEGVFLVLDNRSIRNVLLNISLWSANDSM